jgi:hypothetical protein
VHNQSFSWMCKEIACRALGHSLDSRSVLHRRRTDPGRPQRPVSAAGQAYSAHRRLLSQTLSDAAADADAGDAQADFFRDTSGGTIN